jgi:hypothetical protein
MNDGSDRHGHHPGSGDHGRHDHHGPEGTEFLDLEISRVIHAEAGSLARDAVRSILRSAIEARLRERLGAKLEAIGRLVADDLADDVEANLGIEATIVSRHEARKSEGARVHEILHGAAPASAKPVPKRKIGR